MFVFFRATEAPLGRRLPALFLASLPEIGDEVIVGFEQGDVRQPVVLGSLWNGSNPPPSP